MILLFLAILDLFFYETKTWNNYINGNCFHFNSSNESLYGIEKKIQFLHNRNTPIKNALIILDSQTLTQTTNSIGHLFIKHPLLSGESYIKFYQKMFRGFFYKPMFAHLDLTLTGKRKEYMNKYGIRKNVWKLDKQSNQLTYFVFDSLININPELYYNDKKNIFFKRDTIQAYSNSVIKNKQDQLLTNIKSILDSNHTQYKIIISPLYNQTKLNRNDLKHLQNLFGANNVFDFSGQNNYTNNYTNYYETSHYRPNITREIIKHIYQQK